VPGHRREGRGVCDLAITDTPLWYSGAFSALVLALLLSLVAGAQTLSSAPGIRHVATQPSVGSTYELDFGPDYLWHAVVTVARPGEAFALRLTDADQDWNNTIVGFDFSALGAGTLVRFHCRGWPEPNEHYRISRHCWALYLRILRRHLETGEVVPSIDASMSDTAEREFTLRAVLTGVALDGRRCGDGRRW
jgi:hypothetical protein